MMKKKLLLATLCSTLLIAGCNQAADTAPTVPSPDTGATSNAGQEQPAMDEDTLLTVNGEAVSKAMYALYFQDRMRNVPDAKTSPQMQMNILNELANVIIAAQDAKSKGIDKRAEIIATLDLLRAKLLTQTVIQEFAEENKPGEEQIKTYYEAEYANQSNREFKARHILVKEEAEAKSLIGELDGGADFAELAKAHSTGPTGKNGGDLGWFDANQMVQPFAEAVASMEKGSYTKEPVQTQFGWHVILLEDTRESEPPSLESLRGEIVTKLQQQALAEYMKGLRDKSEIVFNEKMAAKEPAEDEAAQAQTEGESTAEAESAEGENQTESAQTEGGSTAEAESAESENQTESAQTEGESPAEAKPAEGDAKPASE